MGPGPVDVDPRVLRAMSMPLLGQFDPHFTAYMNETMGLYRQVFRTENRATLLVDGSARAGIEAVLASALAPGDKVLVPVFGRFGHLLAEIAARCRAEVVTIETQWGTVFPPEIIETAVRAHRPMLLALVHGDTSTTMAQPLEDIGQICRELGVVLYVDATATIAGMALETDAWSLDAVSCGLQKCLSGPPGCAPVTVNERVEVLVRRRRHVERGLVGPEDEESGAGPVIQSNYLDLGMLIDYWSERRLNHHTEATSMLYAARECARIMLEEGHEPRQSRHRLAGRALAAGLGALELRVFGDPAYRMPNVTGVYIPEGVPGEAVRAALLEDFGIEIGTSFGPLHGRIWRIGTMGYGCTRVNVLSCLAALGTTLRRFGHRASPHEAVAAARAIYEGG